MVWLCHRNTVSAVCSNYPQSRDTFSSCWKPAFPNWPFQSASGICTNKTPSPKEKPVHFRFQQHRKWCKANANMTFISKGWWNSFLSQLYLTGKTAKEDIFFEAGLWKLKLQLVHINKCWKVILLLSDLPEAQRSIRMTKNTVFHIQRTQGNTRVSCSMSFPISELICKSVRSLWNRQHWGES